MSAKVVAAKGGESQEEKERKAKEKAERKAAHVSQPASCIIY